MGSESYGSSGAVTILCNVPCRWDAERALTLTIVELLPNRIIARFRGEDTAGSLAAGPRADDRSG